MHFKDHTLMLSNAYMYRQYSGYEQIAYKSQSRISGLSQSAALIARESSVCKYIYIIYIYIYTEDTCSKLQAAKVRKYGIEIYSEQNTRNSGYNLKYVHTRHPEIQQNIHNSG